MKEYFYCEDTLVIIMELLGQSLYDLLRQRQFKGLDIDTVINYGHQMLKGLNYIHSLGITHTDIRPENILIE